MEAREHLHLRRRIYVFHHPDTGVTFALLHGKESQEFSAEIENMNAMRTKRAQSGKTIPLLPSDPEKYVERSVETSEDLTKFLNNLENSGTVRPQGENGPERCERVLGWLKSIWKMGWECALEHEQGHGELHKKAPEPPEMEPTLTQCMKAISTIFDKGTTIARDILRIYVLEAFLAGYNAAREAPHAMHIYRNEDRQEVFASTCVPATAEFIRLQEAEKTKLKLLFSIPDSDHLRSVLEQMHTNEDLEESDSPTPPLDIIRDLVEAYAKGWDYARNVQDKSEKEHHISQEDLTGLVRLFAKNYQEKWDPKNIFAKGRIWQLPREEWKGKKPRFHNELVSACNGILGTYADQNLYQISTATVREAMLTLIVKGYKAARRVQEELAPILEDVTLEYASRRSEQGLQELMSSLGYSEKEIERHALLIRNHRDRLGLPEEEL